MGFLTPALLGGIALIAIPVALHLVMRRQPREFVFPALRFVQQRRDANRRKLKLRHLLLLALRCLLIALLAAALARPTLKGTGLKGKEGAPLAVSLVIDNSLRMQYVHQNQSRLERATDTALELVEKLPEEVAVCDLGRAANGFAPDLSAAASRLRNLRATAQARPLADVIVEAIRLAAEQEDRRQEVFVFSDLTSAAWPEDGRKAINEELAKAPDVRIYVVDCGVASPQNAALGPLAIRRTILRPGEPLHIEAPVASNLKSEAPLVELRLADDEGRSEKRNQQIAQFDEKGQARITFDVADLPLGTHQGSVQLTAADPLSVDNTRYFTVEVRPPAKVLLLGERAEDARFVREAISPSLEAGSNRFECEVGTFDKAADASLEQFNAVLLMDPGPLPEELWNRLWEFASAGGGVGIFLGHNATGELEAFNAEAPQRLLPGKLKRISRNATYLRPRRIDHPALTGLRDYAEAIPWQACQVASYWQFDQPSGEAYVVAAYANDEPAIYERATGRGRVLVTTTPFSDPLQPEGREPWNVLPAQAWPFVALCDQLVGYLAQEGDERLEYAAGETARIRLGPAQQVENFVLHLPDGQAMSRVATTGENELAVSVTDALGNYRLTAGGQSQRLNRGFSVNVPPEVSELSRLEPKVLTESLPKERVRLADNLEAVENYVDIGRSGRELYPLAIALVALIWGSEHILANRFYREAAKKE
jgi:hypothetical protein